MYKNGVVEQNYGHEKMVLSEALNWPLRLWLAVWLASRKKKYGLLACVNHRYPYNSADNAKSKQNVF